MGQEGHRGVLVGGKGGIRGMKIADMNEMRGALIQERGRHRHIDQHLKSSNKSSVIGGISS